MEKSETQEEPLRFGLKCTGLSDPTLCRIKGFILVSSSFWDCPVRSEWVGSPSDLPTCLTTCTGSQVTRGSEVTLYTVLEVSIGTLRVFSTLNNPVQPYLALNRLTSGPRFRSGGGQKHILQNNLVLVRTRKYVDTIDSDTDESYRLNSSVLTLTGSFGFHKW